MPAGVSGGLDASPRALESVCKPVYFGDELRRRHHVEVDVEHRDVYGVSAPGENWATCAG